MNQIIKDVYTEYYSGSVIVTPPPSNVEFTAGSAEGGQLNFKHTISDKATAISVFRGGPLLDALLERLDAGSSMIYAVRIGPAVKASLTLNHTVDQIMTPTIKLEAKEPGSWWNGIQIEVSHLDHNFTIEISDPDDNTYAFTDTTEAGLVEKINAGQALLTATNLSGVGLPDDLETTNLSGGDDGTDLTMADIIDAIALSEQYTEVSWVHFIGAADFDTDPWNAATPVNTAFANTRALWTAIITSCNNMVNNNLGERFALLDFPHFEAVNPDLPTVTEIQTYVDRAILAKADITSRNAVFILGEGRFNDPDGSIYTDRISSSVSGKMSDIPLQKSLLGEIPSNVISLLPEFSLGQQTQLIMNNINHMRIEPGVGKIIALSNNNPPAGDAYNRIEKIRAIYSAGKQCRTAAFPHIGRANDAAGEGIKLLEEDMKRPLDLMKRNGEIDSYELSVNCTEEMRSLGEAEVILSINSMKAFEIILTKIYLD